MDEQLVQSIWEETLGSGWEYSDWFLNIEYEDGDWDKPCNAIITHFSADDEDEIVKTAFNPQQLADVYAKLMLTKYRHCGDSPLDDQDACTSDYILQHLVYGETIYG